MAAWLTDFSQMLRLRDPSLLLGAGVMLVVAVAGLLSASRWVGQPFPGFLVLENRVIASAGLAHWPATRSGAIYQWELIEADGQAVRDPRALAAYVAQRPVGTSVEYLLRRGDRELSWTEPTRLFETTDFLLLFGTLALCGIGLTGIALALRFLRARDPVARGTAMSFWIVGIWALTAVDLYGPYRFFRWHALAECFLFAGTFHMTLVFPYPSRWTQRLPWLIPSVYTAAAVLAAVSQFGLQHPPTYVATHRIAVNAFGVSLLGFVLSQLRVILRKSNFEARQRVKIVALGAVAALAPMALLALVSATTGGRVPENLMSWTGIFFPLSIGYAVLRADLFGVDAFLRRTLNYALLTGVVALLYGVLIAGFDAMFREQSGPATFALVLAAVSVLGLLPLRDRLQVVIDRLFFRSAYDFRRLVETTSSRLASVADLSVISGEIERAVRGALHPEWVSLEVCQGPGDGFRCVAEAAPEGSLTEPVRRLAAERGAPVDLAEGGLAVPFRVEDRLVGLLGLGRRKSGSFYSGDDRGLLQTLANQGAVAIENALAMDRLSELNRSLEQKVEARTAEVQTALASLRDTQTQMVQQEKMASLGQLVAGVAHEINNPVNFIQGNLHFLREYTDTLAASLRDIEAVARQRGGDALQELAQIRERHDLDYLFKDLPAIFDSCDEGIQRTTTIVQDLRTFSRLDRAECLTVDLHEALESTLGLLRSRMQEIEVVREYGEIPPVECLAGQLNQVFMNLLSNAADAIENDGTITVRTSLLAGDRVAIEVEDNGCGIEASERDRLFEPFYTTKEVGRGTGLGLAITYGIVTRHSGSVHVESEVGRGTKFRVEIPVRYCPPEPEEPDRETHDSVTAAG